MPQDLQDTTSRPSRSPALRDDRQGWGNILNTVGLAHPADLGSPTECATDVEQTVGCHTTLKTGHLAANEPTQSSDATAASGRGQATSSGNLLVSKEHGRCDSSSDDDSQPPTRKLRQRRRSLRSRHRSTSPPATEGPASPIGSSQGRAENSR